MTKEFQENASNQLQLGALDIAQVLIIRFVFRINKQIQLLTEIRDELKQLNTRAKGA